MMLGGERRRIAPTAVRQTPRLHFMGSLVFLTFGVLTSFWSLNVFSSAAEVTRYGWVLLGWSWFLRAITIDRVVIARLVTAFKITVLINCGGAILGSMGVVDLSSGGLHGDRQTAFYNHPNQLGLILAIALPIFVLDVPRRSADRKPASPWTRLVLSGIVLVALGTTGSMGGLMGGVAGVGVALFLARGATPANRRRFRPVSVMAMIAIGAFAVVTFIESDSPVIERITKYGEGDAGVNTSVNTRKQFAEFAIGRIGDSMIVGVGLDKESAFEYTTQRDGLNHNMYLSVLYTAGLPALVGLLLILLAAFRYALDVIRASRSTELHPLAAALAAGLVAGAVASMSAPTSSERSFWFPVVMLGAIWAWRRRELWIADRSALARSHPPDYTASAHGPSVRRT